jgi:pimeloyl-ACP methyl ester carboxylesterase
MSSTRIETVTVPGARLQCEVSGTGPVLLLVAGAADDAGTLAGLVTRLSGKYLTVTYDMRGLSGSLLDAPPEEVGIEVLADDAHRILAAFTSEPAYVLGSGGGGLVGLELVARHPEQVRRLIAHEPAAMALLPDGEQRQDVLDELEEHQIRRAAGYLPDVEFLSRVRSKIVVGVGVASRGQALHRAALEMARRLGVEVVEFPGDHQGFSAQPTEFATVVDRLLSGG